MLSSVASLFPRNPQWVEDDNGRIGSVRHSLVPLLISSVFMFFPHHILTAQPVFLSFSWTDLALFDLHVIQIHKNLNNKRWQCISCSLSVTCAPFSLALWQLCDVGLLSVLKAQFALAPGGRVIWWMKQPQLIRWVFSAGLAWVDRCDHYSGVCLSTGSVCVLWLLRISQLTSVKTSRAPRLPPDTSERSECSLWQVL